MERPLGRRLHTIAGAIVLAAFLVEHLLTNASVLGGADSYDHVVGSIERWRFLPFFELLFIVAPLTFHAGYGLRLLFRSTADTEVDRYSDRRLWVLQRISATIVLVFVVGHLWELRLQRLFFGMAPDALYTVLVSHLSWTWAGVPWVSLLYLIGIGATCFHFANGLHAAFGRRRLTLALGGVLFLIGLMTVLGFATGTRLLTGPDTATAPCGSAVPTSSSRP